MSSATHLDKLSFEEQVFAFLSIIHPEGKAGAEQVFEDYDLLGEDEEEGNPNQWLFHLYMYDEMDTEGECVLYTLFSDDIHDDETKDDSAHVIRVLEAMAQARDCAIDWGGDANDRTFRLALGMDGLLATAGRSLRAQGYTLWRNKSADSLKDADGIEEYSGWITQSADDERMLALSALLKVPVERLG